MNHAKNFLDTIPPFLVSLWHGHLACEGRKEAIARSRFRMTTEFVN